MYQVNYHTSTHWQMYHAIHTAHSLSRTWYPQQAHGPTFVHDIFLYLCICPAVHLLCSHISADATLSHTRLHTHLFYWCCPSHPAVFPQHIGGTDAKAPYPHVCPEELLAKIWAPLGLPPASAYSHSSSVHLQDSLAIGKQWHKILCRVPHIAVPLLTTVIPACNCRVVTLFPWIRLFLVLTQTNNTCFKRLYSQLDMLP